MKHLFSKTTLRALTLTLFVGIAAESSAQTTENQAPTAQKASYIRLPVDNFIERIQICADGRADDVGGNAASGIALIPVRKKPFFWDR